MSYCCANAQSCAAYAAQCLTRGLGPLTVWSPPKRSTVANCPLLTRLSYSAQIMSVSLPIGTYVSAWIDGQTLGTAGQLL